MQFFCAETMHAHLQTKIVFQHKPKCFSEFGFKFFFQEIFTQQIVSVIILLLLSLLWFSVWRIISPFSRWTHFVFRKRGRRMQFVSGVPKCKRLGYPIWLCSLACQVKFNMVVSLNDFSSSFVYLILIIQSCLICIILTICFSI